MTQGQHGWDKFILALQYIYLIMVFYYVIEEILEIRIHKLSYFKTFWNILDVVIILFSLVAAGFKIYQDNQVGTNISNFLYFYLFCLSFTFFRFI